MNVPIPHIEEPTDLEMAFDIAARRGLTVEFSASHVATVSSKLHECVSVNCKSGHNDDIAGAFVDAVFAADEAIQEYEREVFEP